MPESAAMQASIEPPGTPQRPATPAMPAMPATPANPLNRLSRDQRRDILLMHNLGHTYIQISQHLSITQRAVQYTIQHQKATPKHDLAGRAPRLNNQELDNLEAFIQSSRQAHQMTYQQLAETLFSDQGIGAESIRYGLKRRDYSRYVAIKKPFISPANQQKRLTWAHEHRNWTIDQWRNIL